MTDVSLDEQIAAVKDCIGEFEVKVRHAGDRGYSGRRLNELRAALATLEAARWRKCAEESPPANESILIFVPNAEHYGPGVYRGMFVDMGTGPHWSCNAIGMGRDLGGDMRPTHWRPFGPLPESPSDA